MMLSLQTGSRCFQVPYDDILCHPGTLFHDMVTDCQATVGPVQLDPAAPLAMPGADVLTQALYRSPPMGFVDPTTLCQLLAKHQPGEVYTLLQSLLDFLKMPGNIKQWLPPLQQISLLHAGVERLHYHPMASTVAKVILGYQPFNNSSTSTTSSAVDTSSSSSSSTAPKPRGAAFIPTMAMFSIHVKGLSLLAPSCAAYDEDTSESVWVYAVQGQEWPPQATGKDGGDIDDGTLWLGNAGPTYTQLLPYAHCAWHVPPKTFKGQDVGADCVLGRCIEGEIVAALQQVHGGAGRVKVECRRCSFGDSNGRRGSSTVIRTKSFWIVSW